MTIRSNSKKILIIEDEEMISGMYRIELENNGYLVSTADNGERGIDMAIDQVPDLIILDLLMPNVNGFSVLQQLKSGERTKKIPIIILTNYGSDENKLKAERSGAAEFLGKADYTPREVLKIVDKYLK